jgi:hypothetical protein
LYLDEDIGSLKHKQKEQQAMKIKTRIKGGGLWVNHSETLVRG